MTRLVEVPSTGERYLCSNGKTFGENICGGLGAVCNYYACRIHLEKKIGWLGNSTIELVEEDEAPSCRYLALKAVHCTFAT